MFAELLISSEPGSLRDRANREHGKYAFGLRYCSIKFMDHLAVDLVWHHFGSLQNGAAHSGGAVHTGSEARLLSYHGADIGITKATVVPASTFCNASVASSTVTCSIQ